MYTLFSIGPHDLGIIVRYIADSPNVHEIILPLMHGLLYGIPYPFDTGTWYIWVVEVEYKTEKIILFKRSFGRLCNLQIYPIIDVCFISAMFYYIALLDL